MRRYYHKGVILMDNNYKSFIEVQFPVSKISKESYKERKAGSNQTLTGIGKWWGRKPLILVRASTLGNSQAIAKSRFIFMHISTSPQNFFELYILRITQII